MARTKVVMPQMGESITTGTITKWHKGPGDIIEVDEILLEISTDKVESEIPSPVKGRIEVLLYKEGDTVDVGKTIAEIEEDLSVAFAGESKGQNAGAEKEKVVERPVAAASGTSSHGEEMGRTQHGRRFYTPLVKSMSKSHGVSLEELESVEGHGAGGRVNKEDLLNYLEERASKRKGQERTSPAPITATATSQTSKDVSGKISGGVGPSVASSGARVEVIPMDNMRKAIARNMVLAKQVAPHVNSISEVDLSHLVKFREGFKAEFQRQEGFNLTYTPFIMKAIIMALREYPKVNASVEGDNIILKKDINLGCAVAVPGNGLIVPVVHHADTLSMLGLCRVINDLANKARNKKLTMEDLGGGTFTFTNVGSFGTLMATPVILLPQVGIYAAGVIQKRPIVVEGDAIAVRSMMYGTHTYDHRIVDGELGGRFLEAVHGFLREMDPKKLF